MPANLKQLIKCESLGFTPCALVSAMLLGLFCPSAFGLELILSSKLSGHTLTTQSSQNTSKPSNPKHTLTNIQNLLVPPTVEEVEVAATLPKLKANKNPSVGFAKVDLPSGFSLKQGQVGFKYKVDQDSELVIGSLQESRVDHAPRNSGIHWVRKMDHDRSFFMGVKRTHTDAEETTSQVGFLYNLD